MKSEHGNHRTSARPAAHFATTRWTQVLRAGADSSPDGQAALEFLCRSYWYPLYAFVRASGHKHHDAVDLTQEFFAQLLQKNWLAAADPARGRFRSFLLASMKHLLANQWDRAQRIKRGGGREMIELDALEAEDRYALEPRDTLTPEALFERRWALMVIQRAHAQLAQEAEAAGSRDRFRALESAIAGDRTDLGYDALAAQFNTTVNTVKSWVLRLRRRFGEILRAEVAHTLGPDENVDEELRQLLTVVGG